MLSGAGTVTRLNEEWHRNGWILVPRLFSPAEVDAMLAETDRLLPGGRASGPDASRGGLLKGDQRTDRLDPVMDLSLLFAEVAKDGRLLGLASALLGAEAQLFKDKLIAKPPGAIGYSAHQDAAYWPDLDIQPDRFVTIALFLDAATEENGAMQCLSGMNREWLTSPGVIADPDEASLGPFTTVIARPGDVLAFHSLTPHRSEPNRSDGMRRSLLLTYGVDPKPDLYSYYQRHRRGY